MTKHFVLLLSILFTSCTSLYIGNYKLNDFNVHQQPNELGSEVQLWEDGLRTEKKIINLSGGISMVNFLMVPLLSVIFGKFILFLTVTLSE